MNAREGQGKKMKVVVVEPTEWLLKRVYWALKRYPTKVSAFRDSFPYLKSFDGVGGATWGVSLEEAIHFELEVGLRILESVRETDDAVYLERLDYT